MPSFHHLKPGDEVTRMLAGTVPMRMTVVNVTKRVIVCNCKGFTIPSGTTFGPLPASASLWLFDRATGAEIDHELQWGPRYGRTGSCLVVEEEK